MTSLPRSDMGAVYLPVSSGETGRRMMCTVRIANRFYAKVDKFFAAGLQRRNYN